jgi:hypothetical protein
MTVIDYMLKNFETPVGAFTSLFLLSESHLSFHSWPEYNFIAIDCFTCGLCDTEKIIDDIISYLKPGFFEKKIFDRGNKLSKFIKTPPKKIAIKGAGISGLWLSKCLKEHDPNIIIDIYEISDKIGGRFIKENNYLSGAELIHGEKSILFNYVKKFNVDLKKMNNPIIISDEKIFGDNYFDSIKKINLIKDIEKTILINHEYCMNKENFEEDKLLEEQLKWKDGEDNFRINTELYSLIINDLLQYQNNIFLNYDNSSLLNDYDFIINAFPPENYIKTQNSAIKIFIKTNISLDFWNSQTPYLYGKNYMNVEVIELWKNENINTFVLFATANRANKLNDIYKSNNLNDYIKFIFKDIFEKDIEVMDIFVKYWNYGYHYPSSLNKNEYITNELSCGEWLSDNYNCTLSGAIETSIKLSEKIISLIEK